MKFDHLIQGERATKPNSNDIASMIKAYNGDHRAAAIEAIDAQFKKVVILFKTAELAEKVGNKKRRLDINNKYTLFSSRVLGRNQTYVKVTGLEMDTKSDMVGNYLGKPVGTD